MMKIYYIYNEKARLGLVEGGVLVEDAREDRVVHLVAQVAAEHAAREMDSTGCRRTCCAARQIALLELKTFIQWSCCGTENVHSIELLWIQ